MLLWASLLPGPVLGQVRWSRGQEAGSLGGGQHGWSRARTRCPQLLSVQRLDTCRAPRSGRLTLLAQPTADSLSVSHAHPQSRNKLGSSSVAHPRPLRCVISLWSGWEVREWMSCSSILPSPGGNQGVTVSPPAALGDHRTLPPQNPKFSSCPANLPRDPRQLPTFHLGSGFPQGTHPSGCGFPPLGPSMPNYTQNSGSKPSRPLLHAPPQGRVYSPLRSRERLRMQARGEDTGWRDEKLGTWGLRGASAPSVAQSGWARALAAGASPGST